MGFRIHEDTIKGSLTITKENMEKAFPIIKKMLLEKELRIEKEKIVQSENFEDLINALKWNLVFDENGNCINIYNDGLNVAEEKLLFNCIEEYVEGDSFIEYEREGWDGKLKQIFKYKNGKAIDICFVEDYDQCGKSYWRKLD